MYYPIFEGCFVAANYEEKRKRLSKVRDRAYRVTLSREMTERPAKVGRLEFAAEEPLVLEWEEAAKEAVICGSVATLRVISPGDRTFEDLYTLVPGEVRLTVRDAKSGGLVWTGGLDAEFYEEPYSDHDGYVVELTASDFGMLDRLTFGLGGKPSLRAIVEGALSAAGLDELEVDTSMVSTRLMKADGTDEAMSLEAVMVQAANFYDETGEPVTMLEALKGVMQPLGLKMVQRRGKLVIYDLNGLYASGDREKVVWCSTDQMLSCDRVANDVKVTLSAYSQPTLLNGELDAGGDEADLTVDNLMEMETNDGGRALQSWAYYDDYGHWGDYDSISFVASLGDSARQSGLAWTDAWGELVHLRPVMGGSEATCVAMTMWTGGHGPLASGKPEAIVNLASDKNLTRAVMITERQWVEGSSDRQYRLRLTMDLMVDARYNPFEEAGSGNEQGNQELLKVRTSYLMVPAIVTLYDERGAAIAHYSNRDDAHGMWGTSHPGFTMGEWVTGADPLRSRVMKPSANGLTAEDVSCWLEWYDPETLAGDKSNCVGGWQTNRHCFGQAYPVGQKIEGHFLVNAPKGQYLPYPTRSGYVEVVVLRGIYPYSWGPRAQFGESPWWDDDGLWEKLRWLMYKAPKLEVVKAAPPYDVADCDDIEYAGVANAQAREGLEIQTICGTSERLLPMARAMLHCPWGQIKQLRRGERTSTAEDLLIGTLYSQYATRHTKLTGTALLTRAAFPTMTDGGQRGDKVFMLTGCVEDLGASMAEMTLVELSPDEYDSSNTK